MSYRPLTLTAATAILALCLAACGDAADGPRTDPPATVTLASSEPEADGEASDGGGDAVESEDSEDSEADVATIPAPDPADYPGMDENTPEGAEQAFRYFIALTFWGFQTGETEELEGLYRDSCTACVKNTETISSLREKGEYWSRFETQDKEGGLTSEVSDGEGEVVVTYGIYLPPHSEPDLESAQVNELPGANMGFGAGLSWVDSDWVIVDMDMAAYNVK